MQGTRRITVRLDGRRAALLNRVSNESGCDASEVVRRALDQLASPDSHRNGDSPTNGSAQVSGTLGQVNNSATTRAIVPVCQRSEASLTTGKASSTIRSSQNVPLSFPPKIEELVALYRSFGGEVWKERRRLFQRLFASAEVAQENCENPRDAELYGELARIGKAYGLFT